MTPPRNQEAKLRRLLDAGLYDPRWWRWLTIEHEPGCPAENPRTMDCHCNPRIIVSGVVIELREFDFEKALATAHDFAAPWTEALRLIREEFENESA